AQVVHVLDIGSRLRRRRERPEADAAGTGHEAIALHAGGIAAGHAQPDTHRLGQDIGLPGALQVGRLRRRDAAAGTLAIQQVAVHGAVAIAGGGAVPPDVAGAAVGAIDARAVEAHAMAGSQVSLAVLRLGV